MTNDDSTDTSRDEIDRLLLSGFNAMEKSKSQDLEQRRQYDKMLLEILPVADALEELEAHCAELEAGGAANIPRKRVDIVLRLLRRALGTQGIEAMTSVGQPFDLARHFAVATEAAPGVPDDTVIYQPPRQGNDGEPRQRKIRFLLSIYREDPTILQYAQTPAEFLEKLAGPASHGLVEEAYWQKDLASIRGSLVEEQAPIEIEIDKVKEPFHLVRRKP